jgi:hypothetical protein
MLRVSPSPATVSLPRVVFTEKLAPGGTSMELTAECRTFFSQLWFLLSIS